MDCTDARRAWGLDDDASEEEIMRAYRTRSAPFKKKLLQAVSARDKNAFRDALRTLVIQRDLALDRSPRSDWQGRGLGVSTSELLGDLARVCSDGPDLASACKVLGVSAASSPEAVEEAYQLRLRALRRGFARSSSEQEMQRIKEAAKILERVRATVLAVDRRNELEDSGLGVSISLSESTVTVDAGEIPGTGPARPQSTDLVFSANEDTEDDDLLDGLRP